jgi:2-amino-4-hydroxy-6-hydroxymethyldihydropteridine diphosphokinase
MSTVYLGLGSNLGDRRQNLARALDLISQHVEIVKLSSVYETEPVGYTRQPLFLNAVCCISTKESPEKLLTLFKEIETDMGRVPSFTNAPRVIDIDILFYDDKTISTPELTIPHPRITERAFVLVPMLEIAPELTHPENGNTIRELADRLGNVSGITISAEAEEIMNWRNNVSGIR